jgi:hypothetical protein
MKYLGGEVGEEVAGTASIVEIGATTNAQTHEGGWSSYSAWTTTGCSYLHAVQQA